MHTSSAMQLVVSSLRSLINSDARFEIDLGGGPPPGHQQGPSGIDAEGKRNLLNKSEINFYENLIHGSVALLFLDESF